MRAHKLIIKVSTTFQRSTRRHKDGALLNPAGVTHVQNSHRHAVSHQNCLNVTRGSVAISSICFVIIVPLVFEFRDELSAALRPEDVMYALRTVACEETGDFPWRSGTWANYPVFLDSLE